MHNLDPRRRAMDCPCATPIEAAGKPAPSIAGREAEVPFMPSSMVLRRIPQIVRRGVSCMIANFATYVALDLAKRVRDGNRSVAMTWWGRRFDRDGGTGIWSMHFGLSIARSRLGSAS